MISIAPTATPDEEWGVGRTITVTVELDNSRGLLRPGMTGNAKIQCGERRLLDIVTRRFGGPQSPFVINSSDFHCAVVRVFHGPSTRARRWLSSRSAQVRRHCPWAPA